jgi:hypothetical protein
MAIVTNLTFDELNDAAIADSSIGQAVFSFSGDTISLDIKKLTGDSFTSIENSGVVEFMFKLRKLAGEAQLAVNTAVATTPQEQLTSFPQFTYGIPSASGFVPVTQIQTIQIPLNANTALGTN